MELRDICIGDKVTRAILARVKVRVGDVLILKDNEVAFTVDGTDIDVGWEQESGKTFSLLYDVVTKDGEIVARAKRQEQAGKIIGGNGVVP